MQKDTSLQTIVFILKIVKFFLSFKPLKRVHAPRSAGVYILFNRKTKKTYIGETNNLVRRLNQHVEGLKKGSHHNYKLQKDWFFNEGKGFSAMFYSTESLEDKDYRKNVERLLICVWPYDLYNI